jgi:IclR family acetate operon transcriptional repressor
MLQSGATMLKVFEEVARCQPVGVSELSRALGVNKSTTQRCLVTLKEAGWLRMTEDGSARWVITARIISFSRHASAGLDLGQIALPFMQQLRDSTGETVHLAVADGRDSVLLARLESTHPIQIYYPIGNRVPLHASATGKAMLATWADDAVTSYCKGGFAKLASQTLSDEQALRRELSVIRSQQIAFAVDELGEGASAVAAAICDPFGAAVGAISVSGPNSRLPPHIRAEIGVQVASAVAGVARVLFGM